jgi:hypothetical protein
MVDRKREKPIRFVSDFVGRLRETSTGARRLFRGQATKKSLLPRIVRLAKEKGITPIQMDDIEQKMLERFRKESAQMLKVTS